jgi:hypothetical protein
MSGKQTITSPVGRLVAGSLYKPSTTDKNGNPLLIKHGTNAGQPAVRYWFNIAIPKGSEQHWAHTEWGKTVWAVGAAAFPTMANHPSFSWKVIDGDATVSSEPGAKAPCEYEGYKGHWIIKLSSGFAPKIFKPGNSAGEWLQVIEADFVKTGYYVQVSFTVDKNDGAKPGVYLNHQMVAFRAYGEEIQFGANPADAGFGVAPLPQGASATPLASSVPLPATPTPPVATPPAPAAAPQRVMLPAANGSSYEQLIAAGWTDALLIQHQMMQATVSVPLPSSVTPNVGFANPLGVVTPTPPVATPPAPQRVMLPAAAGSSYEQLIAAGWTDALLIQHQMMLP